MRREELVIDGEVVDLGKATISLEYVNNLLTEIDKISASHSYTITLPLSLRNERIFDYPSSVAHRSSKVGVFLDAEYRRNGITVIRGAKAYVSSVSVKGVELVLVWDGLTAVSDWLKSGRTIKELEFDEYQWTPTASSYDSTAEVVEAFYNTGVSRPLMPPPPSVSFAALFRKVMEDMGQPWEGSGGESSEIVNELRDYFVPLCSRGGGEDKYEGAVWSDITPTLIDLFGYSYVEVLPSKKTFGKLRSISNVSAFSRVTLSVNIRIHNSGWSGAPTFYLLGIQGDTNTTLFSTVMTYNTTNPDDVYATVQFERVEDISQYDKLQMVVTAGAGSHPSYWGSGEVRLVPVMKQAQVNGVYDVAGNLPEIKQVDIVKTACALTGRGVVVDTEGTIHFVNISEIAEKVEAGESLDWTRRVVNFERTAERVEFKVDGYAQRNWLRYKADDENEGLDADGCITVDNRTLEEEKDIARLPFAATRGNTIIHYEEKNGSISDLKVEPRICKREDVNGSMWLSFPESMRFGSIITANYLGLLGLLDYAVTMRVFAKLDEGDLNQLEWTRPVYLEQTGQHYIVRRIETDSESSISEITLIQI